MTDRPPRARPRPRTSRDIVLDFLESIFRDLYGLSRAYLLLYPTTPECSPCKHSIQSGVGPGHRIDEMAGQGERLVFIGMLLRTVECVRDELERDVPEIEQLNTSYPAMARGVAILNFLTAGLCRNNEQTVFNLLQLVQELLKTSDKCWLEHDYGPPIKLSEVYNKAASNRILILMNLLLEQCTTCRSMECVKKWEEKLGADLDPSKWHGCGDCELMLVDILMYARKLVNTNSRMLASLRLSFDFGIDLRQVGGRHEERVKSQLDKSILEIDSHLFKLGLTKVSLKKFVSPDGCLKRVTMDNEVMFISGWQEEAKKDDLEHDYDDLQECSRRRLFYIQCKYLQEGPRGSERCCEPQMQKSLDGIVNRLSNVYQNLVKLAMAPVLLPTMRAHMLLEMDPVGHVAWKSCLPY